MADHPCYNFGTYKSDYKKPIEIITTEDIVTFENFRKRHSLNLTNNNKIKLVITHSGCFHADEVLAVVLARYMNDFKDLVLVRSRFKDIWNYSDMIVDVGGVFDPENKRYDHHMSTFTQVFDPDYSDVKLSSAGLVYKYHGKEIIYNIIESWIGSNLKNDTNTSNTNNTNNITNTSNTSNKNGENHGIDKELLSPKNIDFIHKLLYKDFIHYVDANDNGVNQYPKKDSTGKLIEKKYENHTSYANRISRTNPNSINKGDQSTQFAKAMEIAEEEFISSLSHLVFTYLPSYITVYNSIIKRKEVHESGKIILLDGEGCPWKEHLVNIEKELGIENEIKFVIGKTKNEGYRVQTVPDSPGSFDFRKGICKAWRGKDLEELIKVSLINDIIFVHNSGFIGGAKSYDSAIKMADLSLKEEDN